MVVVDDTYRAVRRRLHDSKPSLGGQRSVYAKASIFGTRKGVLVGTARGQIGQLCGAKNGKYRIRREDGSRGEVLKVVWMSNHFLTRSS